MSAPPHTSQRQPLHERSKSQTNSLAIRVVPYSPPRPDTVQSPPLSGSGRSLSLTSGDQGSSRSALGQSRRESAENEGYATHPGSALSTSPTSLIPLAQKANGSVSGPQFATGPSAKYPSQLPPTPATTTISSPANISNVNAELPPFSQYGDHDESSASPAQRPLSRRRNLVTVHADKTFSLLPQGRQAELASPPPLSFSTSSGSHERLSSDTYSEDRPTSPLTTLPERSESPNTPGSSSTQLARDLLFSSSPWNYRMVGGLRKVPKTPDLKQKKAVFSSSWSDTHLTPLPKAPNTNNLTAKDSLQSLQSTSTSSDNANYKVYEGSSSPVLSSTISPAPSSSDSNYRLLGASSSPAPSIEYIPPRTAGSEENYILHGNPSPQPSLVTVTRRVRPEYSQESLRIPPLKPSKKRSLEKIAYLQSLSRESLRSGSLTSISSVLTQETAQFLLAPSASIPQSGVPAVTKRRTDAWAGSTGLLPPRTHMQTYPHQWSSQLSTVISESEGGSEPGSRSVSLASLGGRRSGVFPSNHSRQMPSISSSLSAYEDRSRSLSHSRGNSFDRPQGTHPRAVSRDPNNATRLVRDQDEHGDGLTDLHELQHRPSRTRLSGFFSSISSDRNLHSSASSRANSFSSSSLPAWARYELSFRALRPFPQ
jgi:hypothetical protein